MKSYAKTTLEKWTKADLIDYCLDLQHNMQNEEELNNHMYKTVTAAMHNNLALSEEITKVLEVWNNSAGFRYIENK